MSAQQVLDITITMLGNYFSKATEINLKCFKVGYTDALV
jgi:hypothetical protein